MVRHRVQDDTRGVITGIIFRKDSVEYLAVFGAALEAEAKFQEVELIAEEDAVPGV
jgi:hypothetical protein